MADVSFDDLIPAGQQQAAAAPKSGAPDFSDLVPQKSAMQTLTEPVTDIPHEIWGVVKSGAAKVGESLAPAPIRDIGQVAGGAGGFYEGMGEIAGAPIAGAARSVLGHPLSHLLPSGQVPAAPDRGYLSRLADWATSGTRDVGSAPVNPDPYERAKEAVDVALSATGPKGVTPRGVLPAVTQTPTPMPSAQRIAGVDVPLSRGESTGNFGAIRDQHLALRGGMGDQAQAVAESWTASRQDQIDKASDAIARGMDPHGAIVASSPQEAAEIVGEAVRQRAVERDNALAARAATIDPRNARIGMHPWDAADTVADAIRDTARHQRMTEEQRAADIADQAARQQTDIATEQRSIKEDLGGGDVLADSPQEAADIIGRGVQAGSESAREARTAAYEAAKNMPGEFDPKIVKGVANGIRRGLSAGEDPVVVNDKTMPNTAAAIGDVQQYLETALADTPRSYRPITMQVIDSARKRLIAAQRQALASARATGDMSDVRGMGRVVSAFDDYVANNLSRFSGDAQAVSNQLATARGLHAAYRQTYTAQGAGDTVGRSIQNIIGRYAGQQATPSQIVSMVYGPATNVGGGEMPLKIASRLEAIFGRDSPEWNSYLQGMWSHLTESPAGRTPVAPERVADRIYGFLNGSGRALAETVLTPEMRQRWAGYADMLRKPTPEMPVMPPTAPTDTVGKLIARTVGEGGQPATSGEIADVLFGRGDGVGENPGGVKLAQHVRDTYGADSQQFGAIRRGIFTRLTGTAEGSLGFDPDTIAGRIRNFLDGRGRAMAEMAFSPEERQRWASYADQLESYAQAAELPKDEVSRVLHRIANGATSTEISNYLYGRAGGGNQGVSVRVASALRDQLGESSPEWSALKQGMWQKLTEPAEGRLDWGPQKLSERIHEFLNGAGRPLAQAMYSPAERALIQDYGSLMKKLIPPPGAVNYSNSAPVFRRIAGAALRHTGSILGTALGIHTSGPAGAIAGALIGHAADASMAKISNIMAARRTYQMLSGEVDRWKRAQQKMLAAPTPQNHSNLVSSSANLAGLTGQLSDTQGRASGGRVVLRSAAQRSRWQDRYGASTVDDAIEQHYDRWRKNRSIEKDPDVRAILHRADTARRRNAA